MQAASLAEEATLLWFKALSEVREPQEFGRYLGLSKGSSLCFVVDTTGSMGDEIDSVRRVTQTLTDKRTASANPPSDFVLAPFNDPGQWAFSSLFSSSRRPERSI